MGAIEAKMLLEPDRDAEKAEARDADWLTCASAPSPAITWMA